MKISISLSNNEIRMAQKLVEALGGKTKEIVSKVQGYGPTTSEVNVSLLGDTEFTLKIDENFVLDSDKVIIKHSGAIKGIIATVKGLYETYMSLVMSISKDFKEVNEKYFKA